MVCLKRNRGRLSVFLTIKLSAGGERHAVRHICKTKRNSVIHYWLHQIWLNLFDEEGNYPPPRTLALAVKVLFAVCCWLKGSAIHRHQRGHMQRLVTGRRFLYRSSAAGDSADCDSSCLLFSRDVSVTPQRRTPREARDDRLQDTTFSCVTSDIGYLWGSWREGNGWHFLGDCKTDISY